MYIYVDAGAAVTGNGSKEHPFRTISEAASIALPGDEVLVAPGLYREAVDPKNAGTADKRITYRSTTMKGAIISGAEPVKNWIRYEGNVWTARVSNSIFGERNPYTTLVSGDWFNASTHPERTRPAESNYESLPQVPATRV